MKKFLFIFIMSGILLTNIISFMFISNFHIGMIIQSLLTLAIPAYIFFFKKIHKIIHIAIGVIFLIVLSFMLFLAVYGNNDNPSYEEDVVIVLGAGINGETVRGSLARRLDKAVAYFDKNREAVIIVCGGQGPGEAITEALAMERYLIDRGIPKENIIKEDKSTSTYENLLFAKGILDEYFPQGFSSVVITNDFHVYRAIKTAALVNISATHVGSYTEWYSIIANYSREMLAVVKLWVFPPK